MKKWFLFIALLSVALVALPVYAGNYNCTGTVTLLTVGQSGIVVVAGPGGLPPVAICQIGSGSQWSADACKAAYSTLLAAKLSGQTAYISFNDNLTCSTQPTWGSTGYTSAWNVATQ